jgi:hypothetical protein
MGATDASQSPTCWRWYGHTKCKALGMIPKPCRRYGTTDARHTPKPGRLYGHYRCKAYTQTLQVVWARQMHSNRPHIA